MARNNSHAPSGNFRHSIHHTVKKLSVCDANAAGSGTWFIILKGFGKPLTETGNSNCAIFSPSFQLPMQVGRIKSYYTSAKETLARNSVLETRLDAGLSYFIITFGFFCTNLGPVERDYNSSQSRSTFSSYSVLQIEIPP